MAQRAGPACARSISGPAWPGERGLNSLRSLECGESHGRASAEAVAAFRSGGTGRRDRQLAACADGPPQLEGIIQELGRAFDLSSRQLTRANSIPRGGRRHWVSSKWSWVPIGTVVQLGRYR
ncbi:hypothetical protein IAQ61_011663 [Plenodomus lingam]|uniref:uncharacterized protein n=1 Tax=Leptosphaeria maculans TaxID=5022 RepID=UPI00331CEED6|nr:hypothetical protein IAQ61_011663 [Plenodomus lingam]